MSSIRLQKAIADAGYLSRRKAEEAIVQGRVQVNGTVVTELGTKVDPAQDEICVDGQTLHCTTPRKIFVFHKPRNVMTTMFDPEGRPTVIDYFPEELKTVKPVGRLDFASEGLLILTDDGNIANHLAHPRYGVTKTYWTWVEGMPDASQCKKLTTCVDLDDGPGRFDSVKPLEIKGSNSAFEVVVSEGRNRFVRRMWDAVGHTVVRLKRVRVGEIELGDLPPGRYRELNAFESKYVKKLVGNE